jgi:TolB protein
MKALARLVVFCALGWACGSADGDRIAVAVVPFRVGGTTPPVDVADVIRADLASRGGFAPLAPEDLPARPAQLAEVRFEDWRDADADYLVIGHVGRVHDGGHEVEFRLLDVRAQTSLVAYMLPSAPDQLEHTARAIAQLIGQQLSSRPAPASPRS